MTIQIVHHWGHYQYVLYSILFTYNPPPSTSISGAAYQPSNKPTDTHTWFTCRFDQPFIPICLASSRRDLFVRMNQCVYFLPLAIDKKNKNCVYKLPNKTRTSLTLPPITLRAMHLEDYKMMLLPLVVSRTQTPAIVKMMRPVQHILSIEFLFLLARFQSLPCLIPTFVQTDSVSMIKPDPSFQSQRSHVRTGQVFYTSVGLL